MIAAIYARKSTDQSAVADEAKSVRRQIEHARAYAERRGWTVDERFVFVDDGISGAEFENRPGFMRLMNAVRPRAPFQVLVMSEESRLGRDAIETAYALKQLIKAGVRVWCYLEDRERTLDTPTDALMMSVTAYVDQIERQRTQQRVNDAMHRKARAGHVTGGRVFGYENVEIMGPNGKRSHVERQVNEAEAAIVRRIFELAAGGSGQARIAKQLNAEAALSPRPQQDRPQGWAPSSVHEVLFRTLYRGEITWNRTRKRNRWGQQERSDRPASEWLTIPAPALTIVPDELWERAHGRIAESRAHYVAATGGTRNGRPRDVESKYLLPGFARCSCCNGGLHVRSTHHGSPGKRHRAFFYACTAYFNRGPQVCSNGLRVRMEAVDSAVLKELDNLLTPDMIPDVLARARQLLEPGGTSELLERINTELAAAERQVERLADAIAAGGELQALVTRLKAAEATRQELATRAQMLGDGLPVVRVDWRATEREARQRLNDWRGLLTRQVDHGRQLLRKVLVAPIQFTPFNAEGRKGYRFRGDAGIGGLFSGLVEVMRLASPPGFEPGFQP